MCYECGSIRFCVKTEYLRAHGQQNPSPVEKLKGGYKSHGGSSCRPEDETVKPASQTPLYKQEMWRHLSDYKVSALGVKPNGIWRKNHPEYAHILPFGYQHLNILEPYRDEFWKFFRGNTINLHTGFHHLSSSQAMVLHLFFPFLAEDKKDCTFAADIHNGQCYRRCGLRGRF